MGRPYHMLAVFDRGALSGRSVVVPRCHLRMELCKLLESASVRRDCSPSRRPRILQASGEASCIPWRQRANNSSRGESSDRRETRNRFRSSQRSLASGDMNTRCACLYYTSFLQPGAHCFRKVTLRCGCILGRLGTDHHRSAATVRHPFGRVRRYSKCRSLALLELQILPSRC